MNKKKIVIGLGTRPELIRFSPLIKELQKIKKLDVVILHTGQHYSYEMDTIFFKQLNLDEPHYNLKIGSKPAHSQLAEIIEKSGEIFNEIKPDAVFVWGDTNSSLGIALAANKFNITLGHIEAGCRSHDLRMPEEHNRKLIDTISNYLYPLSKHDKRNLIDEKVKGNIKFVGDPLRDVFLEKFKEVKKIKNREIDIYGDNVIIATLHRAENVDDKKTLKKMLQTLGEVSELINLPVVFPIHPRTLKTIHEFNLSKILEKFKIQTTDPLGYNELMYLLHKSAFVITDSGGFQKEAFFALKPCITFRKSTEWMDTVHTGLNTVFDPFELDENSAKEILKSVKKSLKHIIKGVGFPYGSGFSSQKMAKSICQDVGITV